MMQKYEKMRTNNTFMHRVGFDMDYTIDPPQWLIGAATATAAYFTPIYTLIILVFIFVAIDFVTGVLASRARAKREGRLTEWGFESYKAWNTVAKLCFIMVGIVMAWLIQKYFLDEVGMHIKLEYLFAGFVCGVEFWSYLENAAEISSHPVFRWLKKFMKKKVDAAMGCDIDKDKKDE